MSLEERLKQLDDRIDEAASHLLTLERSRAEPSHLQSYGSYVQTLLELHAHYVEIAERTAQAEQMKALHDLGDPSQDDEDSGQPDRKVRSFGADGQPDPPSLDKIMREFPGQK